jgi:SAM-dependent methyltransferase
MHKANYSDAIHKFKMVLFLKPENIKAKYFLARTYILADERKKAIKQFDEITKCGVLQEETYYYLNQFEKPESILYIPKSILAEICRIKLQYYRRDYLNLGYLGHKMLVKQALLNIEDKNPNLNVLDLGCGYGNCGLILKESELSKKITGVDLSPFALKESSRLKLNDGKVYDKVFKAEILEYLEKSNEKYDMILADRSLNLIGNLEKVAKLIKSKLQQGGKFAVIFDKYHIETEVDIDEASKDLKDVSLENQESKEASDGFVFDSEEQEFLFSHSYITQIFDMEGFNLDYYEKINLVSGMKSGLYVFSI